MHPLLRCDVHLVSKLGVTSRSNGENRGNRGVFADSAAPLKI